MYEHTVIIDKFLKLHIEFQTSFSKIRMEIFMFLH